MRPATALSARKRDGAQGVAANKTAEIRKRGAVAARNTANGENFRVCAHDQPAHEVAAAPFVAFRLAARAVGAASAALGGPMAMTTPPLGTWRSDPAGLAALAGG